MCHGSLLDYLKEGQGRHSTLVQQIDMAAQVEVFDQIPDAGVAAVCNIFRCFVKVLMVELSPARQWKAM